MTQKQILQSSVGGSGTGTCCSTGSGSPLLPPCSRQRHCLPHYCYVVVFRIPRLTSVGTLAIAVAVGIFTPPLCSTEGAVDGAPSCSGIITVGATRPGNAWCPPVGSSAPDQVRTLALLSCRSCATEPDCRTSMGPYSGLVDFNEAFRMSSSCLR